MIFPIHQTMKLPASNQVRGLGDIIHKVAEPIKQAIIRHGPEVVANYMRNCNCEKRRQYLNQLMHF
jgi:hypothetical protein